MVIAHNMMAMNAQRQFNIVGNSKKKSTEKLSSGYRINRAADDAAGLAISEKMRRQIRGLNQGANNTMDGISLLQVADGALAEVHDMLHRVTVLSVQSANGTNTDSDREAIQQEINQIMSEINRISDTTEFNERKLFCKSSNNNSSDIPVTPATSSERIQAINSSISKTGTPTGYSGPVNIKYTVCVTSSGIKIGDTNLNWNDIKKTDGSSLSDSTISSGKYYIPFNGVKLSFDVPEGSSIDDICNAINGTSFYVRSQQSKYNPVTITSTGVTNGTKTNDFMNNGSKLSVSANISADASGIHVDNYGSKSWAELGVSDFGNSIDKAFTFTDSLSGISFSGTINGKATASEVYDSFNSTFTATVGTKPTVAVTDRTKATSSYNTFTVEGLSSYTLNSSQPFINNFYDSTTGTYDMSKMIGSYAMDVSLQKDSEGKLVAKVTDTTSNTSILVPYDGSDYQILDSSPNWIKLKFSNKDATLLVNASRSKATDPSKGPELFDYLANVGKVGTTTVSNFLTYYYDTNKSATNTSYAAESLVKPKPTYPSGDIPSNLEEDENSQKLWIQSGAEVGDGMYITIGVMDTDALGINTLDVTTADGASRAIDAAGKATEMISTLRSNIGAQQNRLEHTYKNVTNIAENTTTAESRIRDTDIAKEMVEFSKQNILEQVGQSMMAQANQRNQSVLSLLQ